MRSWLERNPSSPGRASILLALGRFDEADRAIETTPVESATDAFDREILRQTSAIFRGRPIALAEAERLRAEIADAAERRDRAQCVITLVALAAVDRGEDPVPILASGLERFGEGAWWRRPRRFLLRALALPLVAAPIGVLLFVLIVNA